MQPTKNILLPWWEDFKNEVKIGAIERATILRREEKQKEKALRCKLDFLLNLESTEPGRVMAEIKKIKSQLEIIDTEKYRGAMIRSRAERLWQGETPNRRALSDEKTYARRSDIKQISYKDEVTSDSRIIQQAFL